MTTALNCTSNRAATPERGKNGVFIILIILTEKIQFTDPTPPSSESRSQLSSWALMRYQRGRILRLLTLTSGASGSSPAWQCSQDSEVRAQTTATNGYNIIPYYILRVYDVNFQQVFKSCTKIFIDFLRGCPDLRRRSCEFFQLWTHFSIIPIPRECCMTLQNFHFSQKTFSHSCKSTGVNNKIE